MAKIKITDLPKDVEVGKEELKKITGGTLRHPSQATVGQFQTVRELNIRQLVAPFANDIDCW